MESSGSFSFHMMRFTRVDASILRCLLSLVTHCSLGALVLSHPPLLSSLRLLTLPSCHTTSRHSLQHPTPLPPPRPPSSSHTGTHLTLPLHTPQHPDHCLDLLLFFPPPRSRVHPNIDTATSTDTTPMTRRLGEGGGDDGDGGDAAVDATLHSITGCGSGPYRYIPTTLCLPLDKITARHTLL